MPLTFSPILIPILLAALTSLFLSWYTWRHRQTTGARSFAFLMTALFLWGVTYVLQAAVTDFEIKIFLYKLTFLWIVVTPVAWFLFALEYTGRRTWITNVRIALLFIMPLITMAVIATDGIHHMFWTRLEPMQEGNLILLDTINGFYFWVHAGYSYVLILVGTILVVRALLRWPAQYRGQMGWVLFAVATPWLANAITIFKLLPILIDLTPIAFTITGLGMAFALFRHRLLALAPIARDIVINSMNDGMIVLDSGNHIVDINPAAQVMIGISGKDHPIGKHLEEVLEKWPGLIERYRGVTEAEDEISLGEGEAQHWYELHLSPLRDEQNRLIGQVITAHDSTNRKRTEQLLLESESRFRQIVENAGDMIYRTDNKGRFTYVNPTALRVMGYSSEAEVLGKHYLDLAAPEARATVERNYREQIVRRTPNTYHEFPAIARDGREVWVGQNVQLIMQGDEIAGFQAVARDITAIKQAQEALQLARDQALEASKAKSHLLAKVSHELRTPLGGVLGFAELLKDFAFGDLNPEQKKAVAEIIQSTNYLNSMVNELLDQAQVEANRVILQRKSFAPVGLLQQITSALSGVARSKGLEFTASIAPDLPGELYEDERRLRQILTNLIVNAIKFTKQGRVMVRLLSVDRDHWGIQVSDTGIGIAREFQSSVFEPFKQADNAVTHENRGIGLGLSITKQLVEIMGGEIQFHSEVGKGTTFTVTLPIEKPVELKFSGVAVTN
jgi:PAS domain S-box-containing protein